MSNWKIQLMYQTKFMDGRDEACSAMQHNIFVLDVFDKKAAVCKKNSGQRSTFSE